MRYAGRALVAVAAALLVGVVAAIVGSVDIDNRLGLLFIGPALVLLGAWATIEITAAMRELDDEQTRRDRERGRP